MTERLLTSKEACDYLQVSRSTLHKLLKTGKLKGVKVGRQWRFSSDDVRRFLDEQRAAAK